MKGNTGTVTVPVALRFCMTAWEPRCLTSTKPASRRIAQTWRPERRRSLPDRYLERRNDKLALQPRSDLRRISRFEEDLDGLLEIGLGLIHGVTLARDVRFGTEGNVSIALLLNRRSQVLCRYRDLRFHPDPVLTLRQPNPVTERNVPGGPGDRCSEAPASVSMCRRWAGRMPCSTPWRSPGGGDGVGGTLVVRTACSADGFQVMRGVVTWRRARR